MVTRSPGQGIWLGGQFRFRSFVEHVQQYCSLKSNRLDYVYVRGHGQARTDCPGEDRDERVVVGSTLSAASSCPPPTLFFLYAMASHKHTILLVIPPSRSSSSCPFVPFILLLHIMFLHFNSGTSHRLIHGSTSSAFLAPSRCCWTRTALRRNISSHRATRNSL